MNDKFILTVDECITLFGGSDVYVFGIGQYVSSFLDEFDDKINIIAFVDNYKGGNKAYCNGKRVLNMGMLMDKRKEEPILINSNRFLRDIQKQLEECGLKAGKDFFVCDRFNLFNIDENTNNLISLFNKVWKGRNIGFDNEILIPIIGNHNCQILNIAYLSNYMVEKYKASIVGFNRFGVDIDNIPNAIKAIYKSFGMRHIIDTKLDEKLNAETDRLVTSLWISLKSWEDWKNISIYGIHFGTTMMRDFFRSNMPTFNLKDEKMYNFLRTSVSTIVFWYDYFKNHKVKAVLMGDGTNWEGYIRDIAVSKDIPAYSVLPYLRRLKLDYAELECYQYFDKMWDQLSEQEKKYGIEWARKHVEDRIKGNAKELPMVDRKNFAFANQKSETRILRDNDKLKILICPHSFEEDSYLNGEHIFDNTFFSWLCHLGELSEQTPNYEWYLKDHPTMYPRDLAINDMILSKYHKIIRLPIGVSPIQLKEEGIKYALTVSGSIGHEYPAIGIQVINAGLNPHSKFDFCWNPKTKEEYDDLIFNLDKLPVKNDMEGLYKFYCLNYLYYDWEYIPNNKFFFENPLLRIFDANELKTKGLEFGTWMYKELLKEYSVEKHHKILSQMDGLLEKVDSYRPDIFYKKDINIDNLKN